MEPIAEMRVGEVWGAIVLAFGLIVTVWTAIKKVWPILHAMQTIVDDWNGEEERPGVPRKKGVMERLADIEESAAQASYHAQPNHGGSAYDQLNKKLDFMVLDFTHMKADLAHLAERVKDDDEPDQPS